MYLEIVTTRPPATDLGFLLGKHPERCQSRELSFGKAHVFYPQADEERCAAGLFLEIDAVALSRSHNSSYADSFQLGHYVNDRPYAASSFLSTAIAKTFGSALNGTCKERPELAEAALPLEVTLSALSAAGGEEMIRRFFEPLGYVVDLETQLLDEQFPRWGASPYFKLRLRHTLPLKQLLRHLYVLIPALDNNKHYFINKDEVEKLLEKGRHWLPGHPAVELITRRFLKHRRSLAGQALERLAAADGQAEEAQPEREEEELEEKISLHQLRHQTVVEELKAAGAQSVLDLGCGSGKLLRLLLQHGQFARITGLDVSYRALEIAKRRLNWDTMSPRLRERLHLLHGALTYRDKRLEGHDAAVAVEVIEHLDEARLGAFERVVFEYARPRTVILTTPNAEYNALFETLSAGTFRHRDHRFEWTRAEFRAWGEGVAARRGYRVRFAPIGPEDERHGAPSQMAVFY
ncbi:MAG: 3' terminal RNA ribose 2'-O-methyltransferase Hen1 [Phaeodactylibacter sp.]|nr:3' terminal RNA ribose 2'-O-methyltransferase Hen1 [Phaeodactylibacter sp.]MCB9295498.1 3' terminal RNA ribose 2'-O-methyltransferase Hen1 [Lewinellaceae bacterium]